MTQTGEKDSISSKVPWLQTKKASASQSLSLTGPYRPRKIFSISDVAVAGWRFKLYGIHDPERPAPDKRWEPIVAELAQTRLEEPGGHSERYGVGFIIVHHGREANFVLIDWWVGENMLENHVHVFSSSNPEECEYVTPTGLSACVWELRVMDFEREAWVETVLASSENPDLEAYLERRLEGEF